MKVFISWSGDLSHGVARTLKEWLPSVIQSVVPYVSSEDIDKGARWSSDISKELEDSTYGILCVTPENSDAPWVNFEAGALSKSLERSRVAPFLFRIDRTEVRGPLLQFQSTVYEKEDIRKLVRSLNRACGDDSSIEESRLDAIFDVWWPHLQEALDSLAVDAGKHKVAQRSTQDLLAEILELTRSQQKVIADPERLLPPGYVEFVLSRASGRDVVPFGVFHDLERRWITLRHQVDMLPSESVPDPLRDAILRLGSPVEFIISETRHARRGRRLPRPEAGGSPDPAG